jgi:hypothetical protein
VILGPTILQVGPRLSVMTFLGRGKTRRSEIAEKTSTVRVGCGMTALDIFNCANAIMHSCEERGELSSQGRRHGKS